MACRALEATGVKPEQVNYVNAHATSTPAGDLAEYRALRTALPGSNLKINATKSMIGHLLGAAGAVEAIATVQAIRTGNMSFHILPIEDWDMSCLQCPIMSWTRTSHQGFAIATHA